jgi:hypothetical protein
VVGGKPRHELSYGSLKAAPESTLADLFLHGKFNASLRQCREAIGLQVVRSYPETLWITGSWELFVLSMAAERNSMTAV